MGPSVVYAFLHYFTILFMITLNGTQCGAFIPHYFTILPMITLNGTEFGAFISSLFHHFTPDHTQWDRVWCIHFFIISPFYS